MAGVGIDLLGAMNYPHQLGLLTAWSLGIAQDVLYGTPFGQHALGLTLVVFLVFNLATAVETISVVAAVFSTIGHLWFSAVGAFMAEQLIGHAP